MRFIPTGLFEYGKARRNNGALHTVPVGGGKEGGISESRHSEEELRIILTKGGEASPFVGTSTCVAGKLIVTSLDTSGQSRYGCVRKTPIRVECRGDLQNDIQGLQRFIKQYYSANQPSSGYSIKELTLDDNGLSHLPDEIFNLFSLHTLRVTGNMLGHDFTKRNATNYLISRLHRLQVLDLHGNRIEDLPKEVFKLSALLTLNISGNNIRTLPSEIANLCHLRILLLANNQMECLPSEVLELKNIVLLDVSGNPLKEKEERHIERERLSLLELSAREIMKNSFYLSTYMLHIYSRRSFGISEYEVLMNETSSQAKELPHPLPQVLSSSKGACFGCGRIILEAVFEHVLMQDVKAKPILERHEASAQQARSSLVIPISLESVRDRFSQQRVLLRGLSLGKENGVGNFHPTFWGMSFCMV
eukprot:Nk52_evm12s256 gene=Nk52_evmTU12s256